VTKEQARVIRVPLPCAPSVPDALRCLRGDRDPFALIGRWAGGGAILGSEPIDSLAEDADPFAALDAQPRLRSRRPGAFGGGWIGFLGLGLGSRVEDLPPAPPALAPLPLAALNYYDHVLRWDGEGWWFEALATPSREAALASRLDELKQRLSAAPDRRGWRIGPFSTRPPGLVGHAEAVRACRERIVRGDLFQANLCLAMEARIEGDPLDVFAAAVEAVAPAYGAFLAGHWGACISFSPELFIRRRGRLVCTGPIKGTAGRPAAGALAARNALTRSAKDRAEHVMIVDLMRNDLGRVCEYGSVLADPEPIVEAHPGVWHLVSQVKGRLRPGVADSELLRATFPPGSVTGAPKIQALRTISELEAQARHVYTGAIGFASPLAGLELNVAIRTFEVHEGRIWVGAGGAVVADSSPASELREATEKVAPLIAALGSRIASEEAPGEVAKPAVPSGLEITGRDRPDPSEGVFETVAIRRGRPVELGRHLSRLSRSIEALYVSPPRLPDAREIIGETGRVSPDELARLRITVKPRSGRVELEVSVEPDPGVADSEIALRPVTLAGGLGPHKWCDRGLLDELERRLGATPLLLDTDGCVLEAGWANVWLLEGDRLVTPTADGRLLAGVTRGRLLEGAHRLGLTAREEAVSIGRARTADALLLTSSIRLVTPARLEGDRADGVAPPIVSDLRRLLR
jgi:para-aminobenzoate synthetase/4-amino-4-deoxychorismate lyase